MSSYYSPSAGEKFNLVRLFNLTPDKFEHLDVLNEYEKMKHTLPS